MLPTPQSELAAILTGAAIAPLDDRAFLRIAGTDASRWLNGMVTNSIQSLAPGEGNYNFLLNAQGRIQGDCTLYRDTEAEEFLLETGRTQVAAIQQHLDRFIIMDDVELLPIMDDQRALVLTGPRVADRLAALSLPAPTALHMARAIYSGQPILVLAPPAPLVPRYEIWATPETIANLRTALETAAVAPVSLEALENLRLLEGRPRFGQDIRDRHLAQETSQTHALHFSKGCYLGQEIVERIRSRGQVHRTFSGFRLSALPATLPTPLTLDGKPAGELTSAAILPLPEGEIPFALGYIHREALDRNAPLAFDGGAAIPMTLPFHPS
ncbi:MAG: folate-binding protein [Acidobacteriaceae bacterium]